MKSDEQLIKEYREAEDIVMVRGAYHGTINYLKKLKSIGAQLKKRHYGPIERTIWKQMKGY